MKRMLVLGVVTAFLSFACEEILGARCSGEECDADRCRGNSCSGECTGDNCGTGECTGDDCDTGECTGDDCDTGGCTGADCDEGGGTRGDGKPWTQVIAPTQNQINAVASRKIYFARKSVGDNLMNGIKDLAPSINALETYNQPEDDQENLRERIGEIANHPGFIYHDAVNGDGLDKINAFEESMNTIVQDNVDIAFMKFCFVNFHSDNVGEMKAAYEKALNSLSARFPSVTFVHITAPLYASNHLNNRFNSAIEDYNEWLRETYGDKVFDLATMESIRPDGTIAQRNGVIALADEWTFDNEHLNADGQRRFGGALVAFLAQVK